MRVRRKAALIGAILAPALMLSLLASSTFGKKKQPVEQPPFLYQAGTEKIDKGCGGKLEVHKDGFAFHCPRGDFSFPYSKIILMQYRPNLSQEVLAMKIPWAYPPVLARVSKNKYFTIVSKEGDNLRAVVLRVEEKDMQPYFAEIELSQE